jgi:protein gp37
MAKRLANNPTIDDDRRHAYTGGTPLLIDEELQSPIHLKGPARIGCQLMGDLFHKDVPEEWRGKILTLARALPQHKFFFLTKRPKEMQITLWAWDMKGDTSGLNCDHLWFGVSIEDQKTADERIPILLQTPSAHRWVSIEPMLGPVDLRQVRYMHGNSLFVGDEGGYEYTGSKRSMIDWVVLGGLSLPGGKVQAPKKEWVYSIVEQCDEAGVPCFIKPNAQYPIERKDLP